MKRAMTCAEAGPLLQARADDALPAAERAAVDAHVAACAACGREAARIADNMAYLADVMGRRRLPADFDATFIFALPRKSARDVAAAASRTPPRSVVIGGGKRRSRAPFVAAAAGVVLALGGVAAWWGSRPAPVVRPDGARPTIPEPGPRPSRGEGGPADPRPTAPRDAAPDRARPAESTPGPPAVARTGADVVAAVRAARGGYGPSVARGWALLVEKPAEAAAVAQAARSESSPAVRAALTLCLGYDDTEAAKAHVREFLDDPVPEVRAAAILAMARSHTFGEARKRPVPAGPPLGMAVEIGPFADGPGLADLLGRLASETDDAPRRALVGALAPSAGSSSDVRARLADAVRGQFGEALREVAIAGLRGVQDAPLVQSLGEALQQPGFPPTLRGALIDLMLEADRSAAADALAAAAAAADDGAARRVFVEALGRAGGAAAEAALQGIAQADTDATVRGTAVTALSRYPSEATLSVLERVADADADQQVRVGAEMAAKTVRTVVEGAREAAERQQDAPVDR